MSRPDRLVGGLGGEPRLGGVNLDKGVQLLVVRVDARQQRLDQIDRREPAGADFGR